MFSYQASVGRITRSVVVGCHAGWRRISLQLGPEDVVVMEASSGSFYWADRVEATGATCFVLDPMRFRIIIQAMLTEDGVTLSSAERSRLFKGNELVCEILADHPIRR